MLPSRAPDLPRPKSLNPDSQVPGSIRFGRGIDEGTQIFWHSRTSRLPGGTPQLQEGDSKDL